MSGDGEERTPHKDKQVEAEEVDREDAAAAAKGDDEDTGAPVAPIVKLEEVSISSGEENEHVLLDLKAKLYRFDKEGKQWKERGVGLVKLLKHKESEKVRLLMRQNKTLKICANHLVLPSTSLQEHAGSDKSWVWHATDFSDGELKDELFCIRLGSTENAQKFKEVFEEAQESTEEKSDEIKEAAQSTADLLENLNVKEQNIEEKTVEPTANN
ncbi:hypothetical protein O6H91_23G051400 [Diphasiastrum complanatum]|uniref:Uncharacterized protein n=3 Tax=Diphasiastrum complanatum TaxID=34168 RepID=A0ACC2ABW1_DIPCM|nr:hypothetical protein O6H91_23G051200 [Diphasiastrum complanatum]KAJ7514592.1 hypothetical protein O6H91_23G051400 [Diphasiastrum complanatum]